MAAIAADITATSLIGLQRATAYLIATGWPLIIFFPVSTKICAYWDT
jgi:hypothetical protein